MSFFELMEPESSGFLLQTHNYSSFAATTPELHDPGGGGGGMSSNATRSSSSELPDQFTTISPTSLRTILFYMILLVLGVTGNLSVLISFYRHRLSLKWRITILIIHLSLADLIVISVVIPSEIIWRATIQWQGGDLVCKVVQFGRAFGLYASSMIIVVISVDRLYAIVYPLRMVRGGRRVKAMLAAAWLCAAVAAAPQTLVFSVQRHPEHPTFQQCVTYNFLTTEKDETIYNLFSVFGMYFLPLLVIIFSYSMILWKIVRKSREHRQQVASVKRQLLRAATATTAADGGGGGGGLAADGSSSAGDFGGHTKVILLRRNTTSSTSAAAMDARCKGAGGSIRAKANHNHGGVPPNATNSGLGKGTSAPGPHPGGKSTCSNCGNAMNTNDAAVQMMARAKWKILRLTFIIVLVFVVCWTPYVVMVLWYMFDRQSAQKLNTGLQDGLFMMAVANSCVNPFVYGNYTRGNRAERNSNGNGNPKLCLVQDRSMLTCCGWKGLPRGPGPATTTHTHTHTHTVTDRKKGSLVSGGVGGSVHRRDGRDHNATAIEDLSHSPTPARGRGSFGSGVGGAVNGGGGGRTAAIGRCTCGRRDDRDRTELNSTTTNSNSNCTTTAAGGAGASQVQKSHSNHNHSYTHSPSHHHHHRDSVVVVMDSFPVTSVI